MRPNGKLNRIDAFHPRIARTAHPAKASREVDDTVTWCRNG